MSPAAQYERDVFRLVQEAADVRATLNRVMGRIGDAERLLSPGMRAGTAEAKAILRETRLLERGYHDAAVIVRQLTAVGAPLHVDAHEFYGFTKLPADEMGREYTLHRFAPSPPDGFVLDYDGEGGWRHVPGVRP